MLDQVIIILNQHLILKKENKNLLLETQKETKMLFPNYSNKCLDLDNTALINLSVKKIQNIQSYQEDLILQFLKINKLDLELILFKNIR